MRAAAATAGANAAPPPPKPGADEPAEPSEPAKKAPKAAAGPLIPARKLALPKDAADVEYKALVEHIGFSSPRPIEAVAAEFSASLKQQGWKEGGGSMIRKQTAILKRVQGNAKLTIMMNPAPAGCVVKIFTEGLDWTGSDEGTASAAPKKAATAPTIEDAEAEANKALKEALKNLPKGL